MQLFDLFRSARPTDADPAPVPVFLMRAPLSTISEFLSLHRDAEARITRTLATGEPLVQLFDSQRRPGIVHTVTNAVGSR